MSRIFLRGSFLALCALAITGVFNYLTRRMLALSLPENDYGFLYSVLALVMLILGMIDFGLNQSGTIIISRSRQSGKFTRANSVYSIILSFKLIGGLLLFAALAAAGPWLLGNYYHYNAPGGYLAFLMLASLLFLQGGGSAPACALDAVKAFGTRNFIESLKCVLIFGAAFLFVPRWGLSAISAIFMLAAVATFIIFTLILGAAYNISPLFSLKLPSGRLREIASLSFRIGLSSAGLSAISYMDSIMLTCFSDLQSVALYNIAIPIMQIFQSMMVFPIILTPIISELWQQQRLREISRLCHSILRLMLIALIPAVAAAILFGGDLISILVSPRFTAAAPALTILCAGMFFSVIASILINTLNAGNAAGNATRCIIGGFLANIVLNLILIPSLNIVGAASATALTFLIIATAAYRTLQARLQRPLLNIRFLFPLAAAGAIVISAAMTLSEKSLAARAAMILVTIIIWSSAFGPECLRILRRMYHGKARPSKT